MKVIWLKKTLSYQEENGTIHNDEVDIEMEYIDTDKIKDPKGDFMAQYAWLWHGGDPDALKDRTLADHWKTIVAQAQEDPQAAEKMVKDQLSIWDNFRDGKAIVSIDLFETL